MMSNIAIADFCTVLEQESMSKPVFWYLMFKAFSCNLANQVYLSPEVLLNALHLKCQVGQAVQTRDAATTYYSLVT